MGKFLFQFLEIIVSICTILTTVILLLVTFKSNKSSFELSFVTSYSGDNHTASDFVSTSEHIHRSIHEIFVEVKNNETEELLRSYKYDADMPVIFVGGFPRSGTTLMRALLDSHPEVRCGPETRLIPVALDIQTNLQKSNEKLMMEISGVTLEMHDAAIRSYLLELIARHGYPAKRLCNKDPLAIRHMQYLMKIFPNSKFIFMIRDGRAAIHSAITRNVTIGGFNFTDPWQCLARWGRSVQSMHAECLAAGKERCMLVYYEKLVLDLENQMRDVLSFIDVPWADSVLSHQTNINKSIPMPSTEPSRDQVSKPVNQDSLKRYEGFYPEEVIRNLYQVAPILERLGYGKHYTDYNSLGKQGCATCKFQKFWDEKRVKIQSKRSSKDDDWL